jgi:DUF4097 and DUF4098 domain-containing protein YvlB
MKNPFYIPLLFLIVVFANTVSAADVERTERIERLLRFDGGGTSGRVIVENVFGSIGVKGYDGDEIRLTVQKTIVARSESKADKAEAEVTLDITVDDDLIDLYVDGPFRERHRDGVNWKGFKRTGYKVRYDFELEIPRSCSIELETVDDGGIVVRSIDGDYDLNNVNGGIDMEDIGGSGDVYTVNGGITVEFHRNPVGNCSAGTINGDVRLYFRPGLSADFYLKTMNGEVFTDFEVDAIPSKIKRDIKKNGKNIYRISHTTGVRAGRGGPEFELNTLNGDMFILSR